MLKQALREVVLDFENQRRKNQIDQERRFEHAITLCPALDALEKQRVRTIFNIDPDHPKDNLHKLQELLKTRDELLESVGLSKDYLEPSYRCNICKDTGFVGSTVKKRCSCFISQINDKLYADHDRSILDKQNFSTFNPNVFSNALMENSSQSQHDYMIRLQDECIKYVDSFPNNDKKNIIFFGKTGLGKSFLLNCITHALLEKSVSVMRLTAFKLSQLFLSTHYGEDSIFSSLDSADVLIIDDLGSEPLFNNVTVEYLFSVLNERIIAGRHTIIATNLLPAEVQTRYGERTFSRLFDVNTTKRFHLRGQDVRTR